MASGLSWNRASLSSWQAHNKGFGQNWRGRTNKHLVSSVVADEMFVIASLATQALQTGPHLRGEFETDFQQLRGSRQEEQRTHTNQPTGWVWTSARRCAFTRFGRTRSRRPDQQDCKNRIDRNGRLHRRTRLRHFAHYKTGHQVANRSEQPSSSDQDGVDLDGQQWRRDVFWRLAALKDQGNLLGQNEVSNDGR